MIYMESISKEFMAKTWLQIFNRTIELQKINYKVGILL